MLPARERQRSPNWLPSVLRLLCSLRRPPTCLLEAPAVKCECAKAAGAVPPPTATLCADCRALTDYKQQMSRVHAVIMRALIVHELRLRLASSTYGLAEVVHFNLLHMCSGPTVGQFPNHIRKSARANNPQLRHVPPCKHKQLTPTATPTTTPADASVQTTLTITTTTTTTTTMTTTTNATTTNINYQHSTTSTSLQRVNL